MLASKHVSVALLRLSEMRSLFVEVLCDEKAAVILLPSPKRVLNLANIKGYRVCLLVTVTAQLQVPQIELNLCFLHFFKLLLPRFVIETAVLTALGNLCELPLVVVKRT